MKMKKNGKSQGEGGGCTKNGSYCEKEKVRGGQGRCKRRSEAFVKIQFIFYFICCCCFFFFWGGGVGVGWGGQGGCERRSEAFLKIKKKLFFFFFFFFWGGGVGVRLG